MNREDIALFEHNFVGKHSFAIASYVRETAPSSIPRFNTGKLGDNDDDLTQHETIKFDGGAGQIMHKEDNMVLRLQGAYDARKNELHPMQTPTSINTGSGFTGGVFISAKATNGPITFVAVRESATNKLYKIDANGTLTTITLPVAISGSTIEIMDLKFHKEYLYTCGQSSTVDQNCHRYNYQANTWQDITGAVVKYAVIRNTLYGMNRVGVFSCTNEVAAGPASWTFLKYVGPSDPTGDLPTGFEEFNGAGWITKPSGLYRFDGVDIVKILDQEVKNICKFNGALYYNIQKLVYRFDGTNIELIQDFSDTVNIIGIQPHKSWLAILVMHMDVALGFTGTYEYYNVHTYDGSMFQTIYKKINPSIKSGLGPLISANNRLLMGDQTVTANAMSFLSLATDTLYTTRAFNTEVSILSSDIDCDSPSIFKQLERVEINFAGLGASDSVKVYRKFYDGVAWETDYTLIGTITTGTTFNGVQVNSGDVFGPSNANTFKKVRIGIEVIVASGSSFVMSDFSLHYLSSPRHRWRWQVGLKAQRDIVGNDGGIIEQSNGLTTADSVMGRFTNMLYTSKPVWLRDVDFNTVSGSHSTAVTSIVVNGVVPFDGSNVPTTGVSALPLYFIAQVTPTTWEVLRAKSVVNNLNGTSTIAVNERGRYGTAQTLAVGTKVYPLYRAQLTRILRDAFVPTPETLGDSEIDTDREHDLLLELTEV